MKSGLNNTKGFIFLFVVFSLIFCLVASLMISAGSRYHKKTDEKKVSADENRAFTVVIDAGHGGEDGGASFDGVYEKDINLAVALALDEILTSNGIKTVMTRNEDVLLYDKNSDYRGQKKIQDLATRKKTAEKYDDPIFISIHMNSFPEKKYKGLQVYYSGNDERSRALAESIQASTRDFISPQNQRKAKKADSSIYLLDRLECPAVMVECGFLSNDEERALLCNENYRQAMALSIASSVIEFTKLSGS